MCAAHALALTKSLRALARVRFAKRTRAGTWLRQRMRAQVGGMYWFGPQLSPNFRGLGLTSAVACIAGQGREAWQRSNPSAARVSLAIGIGLNIVRSGGSTL